MVKQNPSEVFSETEVGLQNSWLGHTVAIKILYGLKTGHWTIIFKDNLMMVIKQKKTLLGQEILGWKEESIWKILLLLLLRQIRRVTTAWTCSFWATRDPRWWILFPHIFTTTDTQKCVPWLRQFCIGMCLRVEMESLQYLRKSSMEGQFLLQLQSTPLNNQLCDQIKMLPQGQGSTGIFLPVLEKKSSPLHKARN